MYKRVICVRVNRRGNSTGEGLRKSEDEMRGSLVTRLIEGER